MFTNNKATYIGKDKVLIEAACLSTDTKPTTGIANGSACIEMDTGKTFMFNEEDSEWEELPDSSGSGGGGGSSDFSTVAVTLVSTNADSNLYFNGDAWDEEINRSFSSGLYKFSATKWTDNGYWEGAQNTILEFMLLSEAIQMSGDGMNSIIGTGDATVAYDPNAEYSPYTITITGDCTITIS